jgi:cysteine desulfurase/selenocysteine lyase
VFKDQFPFFTNKPEQVYLDSAATTQKHESVIKAVNDYHCLSNATVHRSAYAIANEATTLYEEARDLTAQLINSASSAQVAFNSGATESINTIASGLQPHMISGKKILILASEHHANILPWQQLAKRLALSIDVINIASQGKFTPSDYINLKKQLNKDVAILAMAHVSNALGNIYPVEEVCRIANKQNILTVIDGTQAVAHLPVDVQKINCDFYVFSGHKMYAPTGVGVLYGKVALLDDLLPLRLGGEMITRVSFTDADYQAPPLKFEGGTPNVAGVIGIGAAAKFLMANMEKIQRHESELFKLLSLGLDSRRDIRIFGNVCASDSRSSQQINLTARALNQSIGLHSFVFDRHHLNDVAALLYQENIAVRVGHHCAMPLMNLLNISGTMRVSIACYTTEQDVHYFLNTLDRVLNSLDNSEEAVVYGAKLNSAKLNSPTSEHYEIESPEIIAPVPSKNDNAEPVIAKASSSFAGDNSQSLPIASNVGQAKGWDNQYRQLLLASKRLQILPIEMRTDENAVFGCESDLWITCVDKQLSAYSQSKIIRGILAVLIEKASQLNELHINERDDHQGNTSALVFDYFAYLSELNLTPFFSVGRRDGIQNAISAIKAKLGDASSNAC